MNTRRILIVDDEPDALEFLRDLLEDNDYVVASADSAAAGLAQAKRERPDLICVDVLMPDQSGISLYQQLKTDPELKDIPVVITSGLNVSRDLDKIEYRRLPDGAMIPEPEGFVEKPVNIQRFMDLISRVLE
jgi:CheY-like chemotaxis protein